MKKIFSLAIFMILISCSDGKKDSVETKHRESLELSFLSGTWKGQYFFLTRSGKITSTNPAFTKAKLSGTPSKHSITFIPLNEQGHKEEDAYFTSLDRNRIDYNYLNDVYPLFEFKELDSVRTQLTIIGKPFWDDRIGDYRRYASFYRKNDSLIIEHGDIILKDSVAAADFRFKYKLVKP